MGAEILEGTNGNKPGFLTSQGLWLPGKRDNGGVYLKSLEPRTWLNQRRNIWVILCLFQTCILIRSLQSRSFYCFRWHGYCVITSSIVFFSQSQILSGNVQACSKIIWPPDRVLYSLLKCIKLSAFADYIVISPNWSEQKFLNDNFSLFKYELLVNSRLV